MSRGDASIGSTSEGSRLRTGKPLGVKERGDVRERLKAWGRIGEGPGGERRSEGRKGGAVQGAGGGKYRVVGTEGPRKFIRKASASIGTILRDLCRQRGIELVEGMEPTDLA